MKYIDTTIWSVCIKFELQVLIRSTRFDNEISSKSQNKI